MCSLLPALFINNTGCKVGFVRHLLEIFDANNTVRQALYYVCENGTGNSIVLSGVLIIVLTRLPANIRFSYCPEIFDSNLRNCVPLQILTTDAIGVPSFHGICGHQPLPTASEHCGTRPGRSFESLKSR